MADDEIREQCNSAAGANCPAFGCGNLALTRTAIVQVDEIHRTYSRGWEKCPACGTGFVATEESLIFQALPTDWTLAPVSHA
jgi:hypothetical protein